MLPIYLAIGTALFVAVCLGIWAYWEGNNRG